MSNTEEIKISLKGKEINLSLLGINFNPNDQQMLMLSKVTDFLLDKTKQSFTLMGYAGTGKTATTKILLKWIDMYFGYSYDYGVTAPTHRAKVVITNLSGKNSKTLQSVLGLAPNVNVEKLDYKNLKFNLKGQANKMPKNLLIVDEGSMVNDLLYDTIIDKSKESGCKVLFIGDKAQIKPVKQYHISKIFTDTNDRYELTKVERQKDGNPIGEKLLEVRTNINSDSLPFDMIDDINTKGEGIEFLDSSSEFISKAVEGLKNVAYYTDYLHSRVITYTNDRASLYNKIIRNKLGFKNEYTKGELIMAYNNVGVDDMGNGIINSCDYIIQSDVVLSHRYIAGIKFGGYEVDLISTDEKNREMQFILSNDPNINSQSSFDQLAEKIEEIRLYAVRETDRFQKIKYWNEYYGIKDSFLTPVDLTYDNRLIRQIDIKYGYAMTCHKSQGSTFQEVFVDYRNFDECKYDLELKNQLLYVGMSRCSRKATLFY